MNISQTNKWGGRAVFCEAHRSEITMMEFDSEVPTDEVCRLCKAEQDKLDHPRLVREAMAHPNYMFGRETTYGSVRIVHSDSSSPSGRMSVQGCSPELFKQITAEMELSSRTQPPPVLGE